MHYELSEFGWSIIRPVLPAFYPPNLAAFRALMTVAC